METLPNLDPRLLPEGDLPTMRSVDNTYVQEIQPLVAVNNDTTQVIFEVNTGNTNYISLIDSYLITGVKLTDSSNADHAPAWSDTGVQVCFKESLGESLWKDIKLYINGKDVSDNAPNLYCQNAFLRRVLTDKGGQQNFIASSCSVGAPSGDDDVAVPKGFQVGWKSADAFDMNDSFKNLNVGTGSIANQMPSVRQYSAYRRATISPANSMNPYQVLTKPKLGMFLQKAALPNNCSIRLVCTLSDQAQRVYDATSGGPAGYKALLTSCNLYLKYLKMSDPAVTMMQQLLAAGSIEYPIKYTKIEQVNVPANSLISHTNLLTGPVPDRVLVAFFPSASISGSYTLSPYCCSPNENRSILNELTSLYINANGKQYPQEQYQITPTNDARQNSQALRPYIDYFNSYMADNADSFDSEKCPLISYDQYISNYRVYVFNTRPDGLNEDAGASDIVNQGFVSVRGTQVNSSALVASTMLVMGIYNAKVAISGSRQVETIGF